MSHDPRVAGGWMQRLIAAVEHASGRAASHSPGAALRYGLPAAMAVAAVVVVDLSTSVLPGGGAFLVLLLPVLVTAIALGFVSGLIALVVGAAGAWLLVPIAGHPWLSDPAHLARFGLYAVEGTVILLLAFAFRRATQAGGRRVVLTLPPTQSLEPPTHREREVLALAARGLSTRAIGEQLFLSENTIKSHLARIYGKLGVRNRAEAVSAGLQAGWISADMTPPEPEREDVT
jgi:DNA-binding CsgD family transcriptional regulator